MKGKAKAVACHSHHKDLKFQIAKFRKPDTDVNFQTACEALSCSARKQNRSGRIDIGSHSIPMNV